jgi:hypothetical protein
MKNAAEITPSTKKVKILRNRPDGADRSRYKNLEKWSHRRWAWEFLRRNQRFIDACEKVMHGSEEDKLEIALNFGLKRYKSPADSYRGKFGLPKFNIGGISYFPNPRPNDSDVRKIKTTLDVGDVLIRFDLLSAFDDVKALTKQLQRAEVILNEQLKEFSEQFGLVPASHSHKVGTFLTYLRLLDALASGKTPIQCAEMLYPDQSIKKDSVEKRLLVKNQIVAANEYANNKYRSLSVSIRKSSNKVVSLGEIPAVISK